MLGNIKSLLLKNQYLATVRLGVSTHQMLYYKAKTRGRGASTPVNHAVSPYYNSCLISLARFFSFTNELKNNELGPALCPAATVIIDTIIISFRRRG